ncbi:MAG: GFA family protein, partial [Alphaproteobacteria bacterium]
MAHATTTGHCLCGAVELEIDVPVFWAWHDHSKASRLAHGAVYTTYVGAWRSKVRIIRGNEAITRFDDKANGGARSFC